MKRTKSKLLPFLIVLLAASLCLTAGCSENQDGTADPTASPSATAKATGLEEAAVEEMYGLYDFDMEIKDSDIEAMEKTEKFMEDTGMIENPVDVASLILDVE